MTSGLITSRQIDSETMETVTDFWGGSKITAGGDCSHEIKRCLLLGRKVMTKRQHIQKQRHYFANKGLSSRSYGFSSGHVWMWELDYEESWAPKKWCFWTVVLEKTLETPLDFKVLKSVHPKGEQFWIFIERTDVQAETPILQPPDVKNWLIRKDLDAQKDWSLEEKGMTEYEMVGWHHRLNGRESEQASGAGDGPGSLVCCSPWGCQESDPTEWLNWTDNHITFAKIVPHSQSCRSHYMNTQSPHHIWWVKGVFWNSSIFYPCFFTWHIELSIHDYPFQISVALLQPD